MQFLSLKVNVGFLSNSRSSSYVSGYFDNLSMQNFFNSLSAMISFSIEMIGKLIPLNDFFPNNLDDASLHNYLFSNKIHF